MLCIRLFLCALCLFWAKNAFAQSNTSFEQFKTMMGQRGSGAWDTVSSKEIWKIRSVQEQAQKPFEHYTRNIRHLENKAIHTVPKRIHFIWIGPKPFPRHSISNLISWKQHHPSWEIFFWTDRNEREPPISGLQKRLISDLDLGPFQTPFIESNNWSEKSDLLRFMIMYQEGGIYTDHDVVCKRALDPLSSHYDFVAGYEPLQLYEYSLHSSFVPNTGLIISRPHHPIMEKVIKRLSDRWEMFGKQFPGNDRESVEKRVMSRTFDPFAYCVSHFIDRDKYRNILVPTSYFHSSGHFEKETLKKLSENGHVYAIHLFNTVWLPLQ